MDEGEIPEALRAKIVKVGPSVTSKEVDVYSKLQETADKSTKLRTILEAWERQHSEERKLRRTYATAMLWGLFAQAMLVNVAFFALGFRWITVEPWVANSFILAVFAEIAGMAFFVIKYLFPRVSSDVLATLEKL